VKKRRLSGAALDRIFEQALLVGSATLLSGCCGVLSRMAPAYSGIRVVEVSNAKDPRLQRLARESYTEGLDSDICESHCGAEGLQGCSLAKLAVQRPEPLPEVRCEYATGAGELRSLPAAGATPDRKTPDCGYVCAYPGREVTSCSLVVAVNETDVLLCRFYEPERCVTHIPSGRPPAGLRFESLPAPITAARYFAAAAYLEAASALAFDDLAQQLTRHRAPVALVERCRRAARDERFHARALGGLAGDDVALLDNVELPAHAEPSLRELALQNVADGCVVETYSALVMAYQARHAASPRLRGLLARVARDERRHALLSWDILAWSRRCLAVAEQEPLSQQLRRARARLEAMLPRFSSELSTELGLPDVRVAKAMLQSLDAQLWRDGSAVA
jgi:hypothetical protein